MARRPIEVGGKPLTVHKAVSAPHFGAKTILVTDTWDYIALWLKRHHHTEARFYWDQSRSFYSATLGLPKDSSPLTAYYCMLNAVKALLLVKKVKFSDKHGVSGSTIGKKSSALKRMSNSRQVASFRNCVGILVKQPTTRSTRYATCSTTSRSFTVRFACPSSQALNSSFQLRNPRVVRSKTTDEAWFCAELEGRYATLKTLERLPSYFERDTDEEGRFVDPLQEALQLGSAPKDCQFGENTNICHSALRKDVQYIHSPQRLWYLKRNDKVNGHIARSTMTLSFAAMHKLSELARYSPQALAKHFDGDTTGRCLNLFQSHQFSSSTRSRVRWRDRSS